MSFQGIGKRGPITKIRVASRGFPRVPGPSRRVGRGRCAPSTERLLLGAGLVEDDPVALGGGPNPLGSHETGDNPMKRILLFAALAIVSGVAGCAEPRSDSSNGTGGAGGQGAGGGGAVATGGRGGQGGAGGGGTGGNRPRDAGPDGVVRRDTAVRRDSGAGGADGPAAAAGGCGFSQCPFGTTCCDRGCGTCAATCPTAPPAACGSCTTNADCRLFDDYCTGCNCRALARTDPNPVCSSPGVQCIRQPCGFAVALCLNGRCEMREVLRSPPGAPR